ncbi:MAG: antibiotic biosynthesis monooxygenase [Alphaproteobacteria bacterium]|nr:antibiotic biosynthesis monooxygenase [Alphaproteobacteria bacterium]
MPGVALHIELKARTGQEAAVARMVEDMRSVVALEPGNVAWLAVRTDPQTFVIVDAFQDETAREANRAGTVLQGVRDCASDRLAAPPDIREADVVGDWTRS